MLRVWCRAEYEPVTAVTYLFANQASQASPISYEVRKCVNDTWTPIENEYVNDQDAPLVLRMRLEHHSSSFTVLFSRFELTIQDAPSPPPAVHDFPPWGTVGADVEGSLAEDQSGRSVALSRDGNVLAVGSHVNSPSKGDPMRAHVRLFEWNETTWTQRGSTINVYENSTSHGHVVALSADGHRVVIGAPSSGSNSGSARVYEWGATEGAWEPLGDAILGNSYCVSGWAVAMSADGAVFALGEPYCGTVHSGRVRVFAWNGTSWAQVGSGIEGVDESCSGWSVALSNKGHVVAIGAPVCPEYSGGKKVHIGYAQVFALDGAMDAKDSHWEQLGVDIESKHPGDSMGEFVALNGNGTVLAVGYYQNNSGSVLVFEWNEATNWTQRGQALKGLAPEHEIGYGVIGCGLLPRTVQN